MPSGKELEQLPMSNTAPGMGEGRSKYQRESLSGYVDEVRATPSKATNEDNQES